MPERDRNMNLRVSADELAMLRALAERDGLSGSDFLRQYIRRSYVEHFGEKKPTRGRK
jgi:uncharacterized protein (DUF1778 family)